MIWLNVGIIHTNFPNPFRKSFADLLVLGISLGPASMPRRFIKQRPLQTIHRRYKALFKQMWVQCNYACFVVFYRTSLWGDPDDPDAFGFIYILSPQLRDLIHSRTSVSANPRYPSPRSSFWCRQPAGQRCNSCTKNSQRFGIGQASIA